MLGQKIRFCDQLIKDEFSELFCIGEEGKHFIVPIIWGTDERAAAVVFSSEGGNIDRIRLPILAIHSTNCELLSSPDPDVGEGTILKLSYKLTAWCMYMEEVHQLMEQILCKFTPIAKPSKGGYNIPIQLNVISNNLDDKENANQPVRVIKYCFDLSLKVNFTALNVDEK